ncbi:MAG: response regulator [Lachnospiraceae bacterium]|nr:response regulator [Lachnospiraceae bacterium]
MNNKRKHGFTVQLAIAISVMLLVANMLLGLVLMNNSKTAMKTLIHNRMFDISNTAADMLDGDALRDLKAEDKGTEKYQLINDTLKVFQDNIDLKYIYCVRDMGNGSFTFTVDPAIEDPGEFGAPVEYTEALATAAKGTSAVDEEPYTDAWGRFYSAYSPVFDSDGKVAGIVAVDFSAEWYDAQITKQTRAILFNSLIAVVVGIAMVIFATMRMSKRLNTMTDEITELSRDVDELTSEINQEISVTEDESEGVDEIMKLGNRLHRIRNGLREYTANLHSQANSMITALSSEYRSVYYIDLDKNQGICYQEHTELESGLKQGEEFPYVETMKAYANNFVTEKYREEFLKFIEPDAVRKGLEKERIITLRYMVKRFGTESYEMLRMAGVRRPEDRDDHIVHAVGMGFTDVDAETRKTLSQSQALSDALAVAESANRAKTAFLSSMSHEIRTPMNAIIGLDRIALNDPAIPETTRDQLQKIGSSADHLLSIINDILDMSRIEAGRMVIKNEVFSLNELLDQINVMIGGQCREKDIAYTQELKGGPDEFYVGDDMKLKQVLINILGNSVKFTPEGGSVNFIVEKVAHYDDKTTLEFVISDTGVGMSEEYLPKLFEPFSQEDATTKTKYGSTGLGMSITKSIVEQMNGEIKVKSKKGEGTTFTVAVTLADYKQEISAAEALEKVKAEHAKSGSFVPEQTEDKEVADLTGRHVLLAEDVDVNAEIIEAILELKEITADRAENGRIAVETFAAHEAGFYDAILMDMRMPEMDGLEAARAIRAMERDDAKTIPIIALTANAFDEDVQRSLQAGLNAHLSKPIDPDSLYETLESLIKP